MRSLFKTMASLAVSCVLAAGPLAHADDLDAILAAKKIRVGIDLSGPPYGMMDERMQPTGFEVDMAKNLAADLGVQLEVIQLTGANRVPYLQTNKVDAVLSNFSITPERKKVIAFSKPYSVTMSSVGVPERLNVKSLNDLVGKKVGVARGQVNDTLVTTMAPPGVQVVRFDDDSAASTAILTGQIDAYVTAPALFIGLNKKNPNLKLKSALVLKYFQVGVGLRQQDTKLQERVDQWIDKQVRGGFIPETFEKWFGMALPVDELK